MWVTRYVATSTKVRLPFRVLALDGGGLRGILPATTLAAIEALTGRPIATQFDLIVGTSTGGILSLALAVTNSGVPAYSAEDLRQLYFENAATIFPLGGMPLVHNSGLLGTRTQLPPNATLGERIKHFMGYENIEKVVAPVGGSRRSLYSPDGLERVLNSYFGEARLGDAVTQVAVTSYDYQARRTVLFRNYSTDDSNQPPPSAHALMREVARATSAGPTFFPPASVEGFPGVFVDGGVTANNPSMIAYVEAQQIINGLEVFAGEYAKAYRKVHPDDTKEYPRDLPVDIFLVSIGTGVAPLASDDVTVQLVERENWLALAHDHLMGALFTGLTELHNEQLNQLLNVVVRGESSRYFRIQTPLQEANFAMDDARPENLEALARDAQRMVEEHADDMQAIARQLLAYQELYESV